MSRSLWFLGSSIAMVAALIISPALATGSPQGLSLATSDPVSKAAPPSAPTPNVPTPMPDTQDTSPALPPLVALPGQNLADRMAASDSELSHANNQLLSQNAELSRQVDDLTTQVHVLVQERSGQLYIYGASTAIFCLVLGFVAGKLSNRNRW